MALVKIRQLSSATWLGLWRMDESPAELCALYPHLGSLTIPFKSDVRQKEFLCIRALLVAMTDNPQLTIGHYSSGKPFVQGYQISISHTKDYAVLILSLDKNVAVDIEYRSERVARVVHKFIRPDELVVGINQQLTVWSAKETLYKLHSADDLQYFEMRTLSIGPKVLVVENLKRNIKTEITVVMTDDYVLTYAIEALPA